MATFMLMMVPRAAVCADRIGEVLRHRVVGGARRRARSPSCARDGRAGAARRARSTTRAPRRRCCATSRFTAHARADHGDHRQHRRRQDDAAVDWSRGCSTPPRARCWSTASTCASSTPTTLWRRIGLVPQRPYLFSGTVASNLRYGNPDATDEELWAALEIAQARDFVEAMPERPRRADRAGRHERLRRPAAAPGDRPSAGARPGDLPVRRLVLGARPRHRRAAARRAAAGHRRRDGGRSSPSGCPRSSTPTRSSCSRTARSSASARHDELLETCPTYAEIVESQLDAQEAAA